MEVEATLAHYFSQFLPGRFGQEFIDALPSKTDWTRFKIRDGSEEYNWLVCCCDDRLTARESSKLTEDSDVTPRCIYRMSAETFLKIIAAELNPQMAFFSARLKIDGDVLYALQLGALLGHFFKQFPFSQVSVSNRSATD